MIVLQQQIMILSVNNRYNWCHWSGSWMVIFSVCTKYCILAVIVRKQQTQSMIFINITISIVCNTWKWCSLWSPACARSTASWPRSSSPSSPATSPTSSSPGSSWSWRWWCDQACIVGSSGAFSQHLEVLYIMHLISTHIFVVCIMKAIWISCLYLLFEGIHFLKIFSFFVISFSGGTPLCSPCGSILSGWEPGKDFSFAVMNLYYHDLWFHSAKNFCVLYLKSFRLPPWCWAFLRSQRRSNKKWKWKWGVELCWKKETKPKDRNMEEVDTTS